MKVFIENQYFNLLDKILESSYNEFAHKKIANINSLIHLFTALPVYCDINIEEIKTITDNVSGNKNFTSLKEIVITQAIKNQTLKLYNTKSIPIEDHSAFYFYFNKSISKAGEEKGVFAKDIEFDGSDCLNNFLVVDKSVKNDWEILKTSIPPCNAMLIIDKYVFSHPFKIKIEGLLKFLKLYKGKLKDPFHLSIIYSDEKAGVRISKEKDIDFAFTNIKELGNVELEFIADNNIPTDDRLIFTNYTSGNIGHPFGKHNTRFNQKFLGFGNDGFEIMRNYKEYKRRLSSWFEFIQNVDNCNRRTSSNFKNRLFTFIQ